MIAPIGAMIYSPFVEQDMGMMIARIVGDDLAILAEMMDRGELTAAIDRRYPLEEVADAVRYSEEGRARGKIIIAIREE